MTVHNMHERHFAAPLGAVGALLDSLASPNDRLWPHNRWPAMCFDRPLGVGAVGGHGPIRYEVETYIPGRAVGFRFTAPRGFLGTHGYEVVAAGGGSDGTYLRHTLVMRTAGLARLSWPLVFRPLHDALIEDSLDRAAVALGLPPVNAPWSPLVRGLRWLFTPRARAHRGAASRPRAT